MKNNDQDIYQDRRNRGYSSAQEQYSGQPSDVGQNKASGDDYRRHGGYCGRGGHCGRDQEMRQPYDDGWKHKSVPEDNLYGLMRQSGHYLFHRANGNVAHGQQRILHILSGIGGMSQKELQQRLGIQPGSMSEILNKIEEKGWIRRVRNEEDARKVDISLTEEGKAQAAAEQKNDTAELFQALTSEEQEQLKSLMTKLVASWLKETADKTE